ncbi:MAG: acyl-CoA carboxylase subunit epsilon [Nocardioides sp.]
MSEKDETEPVENKPPLFVVKGDATAEEVAALVAVLQGMAAAATPPAPKPRPEWSAHHRKARPSLHAGPGGWRSSAMPR